MSKTKALWLVTFLALIAPASGCVQSEGNDTVTFQPVRYHLTGKGTTTLFSGEPVDVEIGDRVDVLGPRGESVWAIEATVKRPKITLRYHLSEATGEPFAHRSQGNQTLFLQPYGGEVAGALVFLPMRWAGLPLQIGQEYDLPILGMTARLAADAPDRARLSFEVTTEENGTVTRIHHNYLFRLHEGTTAPTHIEEWYASEGSESLEPPRVVWEGQAEVLGPLSLQPSWDSSFFPSGPVMPTTPWQRRPSSGTPATHPFPFEQALAWAQEDSAEVAEFFRGQPDAFLAVAEYYDQSAGAPNGPRTPLSLIWIQEWWGNGVRIRFQIQWDVPLLASPAAQHTTSVVERGPSTLRDASTQHRPPMVTWDAAFDACMARAGDEPGFLFGFDDYGRFSAGPVLTYGGVPMRVMARYFCGGTIREPAAWDAYTGLLLASGSTIGGENSATVEDLSAHLPTRGLFLRMP